MPHKPHRNPHPGVVDRVYESLTVKTPCYGMAMRRTPDGAAVIRFHYSADPTMTPARLAEIRKRFLGDEGRWAREMEMDVHALSGQLIYPEFDPAIHVMDDDELPRLMTRYFAVDPHPRTPYAFLWIGVDRYNDVWVYRDYWPSRVYGLNKRIKDTEEEPQYTTKEYVEVVASLEGNRVEWVQEGDGWYGKYVKQDGGEEIVYRYMDQAGKAFKVSAEGTPIESIASRFRDYGMPCMDPYKIHKAGEDAIREMLRPRRWEGRLWPRLHVARSCRELIWEFQNLRYAPTRGDVRLRELNQDPVKVRSHSLDLLRYLATSPIDWIANLAS